MILTRAFNDIKMICFLYNENKYRITEDIEVPYFIYHARKSPSIQCLKHITHVIVNKKLL